MDCFYAAIEMRDNPDLRDKAVAVGGKSRRSVLCTANYEARKYGVRSAMPSSMALQKCPQLVIVPVQFDLYREESRLIFDIFRDYTDLIQNISLDEAFLDVTNCQKYKGSATLIAQEIRHRIYQEKKINSFQLVSRRINLLLRLPVTGINQVVSLWWRQKMLMSLFDI